MSYQDNFQSLREVILACKESKKCLDEKDSCIIMEQNIKDIVKEGFMVGNERPLKGYNIEITSSNQNLLNLTNGNITRTYKQAESILDDSETRIKIKVYS